MSGITEYLNSAKDGLQYIGEAVGVFAVGLGLGIVGVLRKKNISLKSMRAKEQRFVQRHSQIHELLTELRITVRASRCLVFQDIIHYMDESASKIISVSSLPPSAFRSGLEINSVEYFSITPLRCMDGLTPLGFVCCHWCSADQLDAIETEGVSQTNLERVISDSVHDINTYLSYKAETK